MTMQEVLNKEWEHFVTNKNPQALHPDGSCQYRTPSGAGCAIGILIPYEVYDPALEGSNLLDLEDYANDRKPRSPTIALKIEPAKRLFEYINKRVFPLDGSRLDFLDTLQTSHDEFSGTPRLFPEHMRACLTNIARNYNLEVPA